MTLSAEMGTLLVISQVRTVDARFVHHDGSDLKALIRDAAKEFIASSRVQCAYAMRRLASTPERELLSDHRRLDRDPRQQQLRDQCLRCDRQYLFLLFVGEWLSEGQAPVDMLEARVISRPAQADCYFPQ
jgi:hypothetical protein